MSRRSLSNDHGDQKVQRRKLRSVNEVKNTTASTMALASPPASSRMQSASRAAQPSPVRTRTG